METLTLQQHLYASVPVGLKGNRGFQTLGRSEGLGDEKLVEPHCMFTRPNVRRDRDISALPVNYGWFRIADGRLCVHRIAYSGTDEIGRPGNFMAHNLVLTEREADAIDFDIPALLRWFETRSPVRYATGEANPGGSGFARHHKQVYARFGQQAAALSALPAIEVPVAEVQAIRADLDKRLDAELLAPARAKLGAAGLTAVFTALLCETQPRDDRPVRIAGLSDGADQSGAERRLIELIYGLLPHQFRRRMTFATYEPVRANIPAAGAAKPHERRRLVFTTMGETAGPAGPTGGSASSSLWIVDLEKGRHQLPPVGRVAKGLIALLDQKATTDLLDLRAMADRFEFDDEFEGLLDVEVILHPHRDPLPPRLFGAFARLANRLRSPMTLMLDVGHTLIRRWPELPAAEQQKALTAVAGAYLSALRITPPSREQKPQQAAVAAAPEAMVLDENGRWVAANPQARALTAGPDGPVLVAEDLPVAPPSDPDADEDTLSAEELAELGAAAQGRAPPPPGVNPQAAAPASLASPASPAEAPLSQWDRSLADLAMMMEAGIRLRNTAILSKVLEVIGGEPALADLRPPLLESVDRWLQRAAETSGMARLGEMWPNLETVCREVAGFGVELLSRAAGHFVKQLLTVDRENRPRFFPAPEAMVLPVFRAAPLAAGLKDVRLRLDFVRDIGGPRADDRCRRLTMAWAIDGALGDRLVRDLTANHPGLLLENRIEWKSAAAASEAFKRRLGTAAEQPDLALAYWGTPAKQRTARLSRGLAHLIADLNAQGGDAQKLRRLADLYHDKGCEILCDDLRAGTIAEPANAAVEIMEMTAAHTALIATAAVAGPHEGPPQLRRERHLQWLLAFLLDRPAMSEAAAVRAGANQPGPLLEPIRLALEIYGSPEGRERFFQGVGALTGQTNAAGDDDRTRTGEAIDAPPPTKPAEATADDLAAVAVDATATIPAVLRRELPGLAGLATKPEAEWYACWMIQRPLVGQGPRQIGERLAADLLIAHPQLLATRQGSDDQFALRFLSGLDDGVWKRVARRLRQACLGVGATPDAAAAEALAKAEELAATLAKAGSKGKTPLNTPEGRAAAEAAQKAATLARETAQAAARRASVEAIDRWFTPGKPLRLVSDKMTSVLLLTGEGIKLAGALADTFGEGAIEPLIDMLRRQPPPQWAEPAAETLARLVDRALAEANDSGQTLKERGIPFLRRLAGPLLAVGSRLAQLPEGASKISRYWRAWGDCLAPLTRSELRANFPAVFRLARRMPQWLQRSAETCYIQLLEPLFSSSDPARFANQFIAMAEAVFAGENNDLRALDGAAELALVPRQPGLAVWFAQDVHRAALSKVKLIGKATAVKSALTADDDGAAAAEATRLAAAAAAATIGPVKTVTGVVAADLVVTGLQQILEPEQANDSASMRVAVVARTRFAAAYFGPAGKAELAEHCLVMGHVLGTSFWQVELTAAALAGLMTGHGADQAAISKATDELCDPSFARTLIRGIGSRGGRDLAKTTVEALRRQLTDYGVDAVVADTAIGRLFRAG